MRLSDLQSKNIVNVLIIDVNVNEAGAIESLVIENNKRLLSFSKEAETVVLWKDITKIGEDVILVNKNHNYK